MLGDMDANEKESLPLPPILERVCEDDEEGVNPGKIDALVDATDEIRCSGDIFPKGDSIHAIRKGSSQPNKRMSKLETFTGIVTAEVDSFFTVFGRLGVAMVIVFSLSALWTFMLAFIQIYTNDMANAIMNTTQFDNGQFWMLAQIETSVVASSVVLLFLFGVGYLWLVVYMLFGRRWFSIKRNGNHGTAVPSNELGSNRVNRLLRALKSRFTHPTPIERHYFVGVGFYC